MHVDSGLLFLDQKAFDQVSHEYLGKLPTSLGFSRAVISHDRLLYRGTSSLMKINQRLGAPFPVTRGVRQGCPLSGLLYTVSIEPLLCHGRQNLSGLKVPGSENAVVGLSMYVGTTYASWSMMHRTSPCYVCRW